MTLIILTLNHLSYFTYCCTSRGGRDVDFEFFDKLQDDDFHVCVVYACVHDYDTNFTSPASTSSDRPANNPCKSIQWTQLQS